MYALNLIALCTLSIAASEGADAITLLGACAAGLTSLFTMGSGFLAPAIAAAICLARWRREPLQGRHPVILCALFAGFAATGALLYREAPFQSTLYARTWADFWQPLVSRAAWPLPPRVGWAALAWVPCLAAGAAAVLRRRASVLDWFVVGIVAWALLDAVALAHNRPKDLPPFDPKYYTAMSLGVAASVVSAAAMITRWPARRGLVVLCAAASLATVVAMDAIAIRSVQASRDQLADRVSFDRMVRRFLATGDPTQIQAQPYWKLPYWNGAELVGILDSPDLQPWLPAVYRRSAAQRPGSPIHGPQDAGALTIAARSLMKSGFCLFLVGAGILAWCVARPQSRSGSAGAVVG
jgi:hypothetical protein